MSARSPFRSHLLQQWTSSRRSPIVVQSWLQQATIDENAEGMPTSARTRHCTEHNRRSMHKSSHQYSPSLSSVESSSSSTSISMTTTRTSGAISSKSYDKNEVNHGGKKSSPTRFSVGFPFDSERRLTLQSQQKIVANGRQEDDDIQKIMSGCRLLQPSHANQALDALREIATYRNTTEKEYSIQSMNGMIHKPENSADSPALTLLEESSNQGNIGCVVELKKAIDRALLFAKGTDVRNHCLSNAQTEPPFTFRKLLSSSRSGRQLIDICFQITSRTTCDELLARKEQKRWSEVPAFLVAIVHNNQEKNIFTRTTTKKAEKNNYDNYEALDYSPPVKEQQLEDYASACAAVQRVIHTLEKDGFAPEVNENTNIT